MEIRHGNMYIEEKSKNFFEAHVLWTAGVAFTFLMAAAGFVLSKVPVLDKIGPMACAMLLAVAYRQFKGYPERFRAGIQFSSKSLLRLAIIMYGLKLKMNVVIQQGLGLLARDMIVITFAILATVWLGKKLKADSSLTLLLGVGTGVCGAAAIAAVSPILKAKEEDTALGVGIVALVGTFFSISYTILQPFLPLSASEYGIWSGLSLHELAHAALAGAAAGQDGLAFALLAKLGRVLLLVPLCLIFVYWMKRKDRASEESAKIEFPWFLIGFIAMSLFGSYVLGDMIPLSEGVSEGLSSLTSFLLTSAMVGLGLNVSLASFWTKAARPLLAMVIASVLLSVISFFLA